MTRIVAGTFKGRRLRLPSDSRVRPTADRVRESWFSILAPWLDDATVLDLYAGSGALGFEALSRGARHVTFVDVLPASLAAIRANASDLDVESQIRVVRGEALRFVRRLDAGAVILALADPPYGHRAAERLVDAFRECPFASVLALEHDQAIRLDGDTTRRFGSTSLTLCYAP